jgi:hypothetical protein
MPTGYRKTAQDFEDRFDPDIMGDGPEAANVKSGGVPLKFADISYGTKGPDVGIREGGVDISNKWAAAGTAVYVDPEAVPLLMEDLAGGPSGPQVSSVAFQFNSNGSMTLDPATYGPRNWFSPNSAGVGDDYEIRFTEVDADSLPGTVFTGTLDTWLSLSLNHGVSLVYTRNTSGSFTAMREILVEMRRLVGGTIVFSRTVRMEATSDIS